MIDERKRNNCVKNTEAFHKTTRRTKCSPCEGNLEVDAAALNQVNHHLEKWYVRWWTFQANYYFGTYHIISCNKNLSWISWCHCSCPKTIHKLNIFAAVSLPTIEKRQNWYHRFQFSGGEMREAYAKSFKNKTNWEIDHLINRCIQDYISSRHSLSPRKCLFAHSF